MARNNIPADDGLVTDGFNAVDAALDAAKAPNWWPGQWGIPGACITGSSTKALTAGVAYATPFRLAAAGALAGVGIAVSAAGTAGSTARLGVYSLGASLTAAAALVVDAGAVAIDAAVAVTLAPSTTLPAGRYLLVVLPSANCTVRAYRTPDLWGLDRPDPSDYLVRRTLSVAQTYGALPASLTCAWSSGWDPLTSDGPLGVGLVGLS